MRRIRFIRNRTRTGRRRVNPIGIIILIVIAVIAVIVLTTQTAKAQSNPTAADGKSKFPDDFVLVRAAQVTNTIGSPASERGRGHEPQRMVALTRNFYIGKYPVTTQEYDRVVTADAQNRFFQQRGMGFISSHFRNNRHNPVESITWWHAILYCNERSRLDGLTPAYTVSGTGSNRTVNWNRAANGWRLPTEAEWEIACRAGTSTAYSFGNTLTDRQANFGTWDSRSRYTGRGSTTVVGSYPPNAWGIYDMHGNVWEWCWDWHVSYTDDRGREAAPWTGRATDPSGPSRKPAADYETVGPEFPISNLRVVKGGSWNERVEDCRSAKRAGVNENYYEGEMNATVTLGAQVRLASNGVIGFRIVRNAQ